MPFTSDKISYGKPHEQYPQSRVVTALNQLKQTLELNYEPVAITFFYTKEEFDAYPGEAYTHKMAYCQMVKLAAAKGETFKTTLCNHTCDGATTALGLEPSTQEIESGRTYFSYKLYSSVACAHRLRSEIKSFHRENIKTYGVALAPLRSCTQTPDVIIAVTDAYQTMRMVQGYEYFTGKKPQVDLGAMQAMCSEVTVSPYLTGEMNVSVMCPSTRMLCKWSHNDLLVGIPYELFETIVQGVVATEIDE